MNKDTIGQKIMEFTQENIGVELSEYEEVRDSGVDSLSLVLLITGLEEVFGIQFNEDDLDPDKLVTLSDLVELVGKYV